MRKHEMTKEELIKHLLEYNLTDEFMEAMSKRIQGDNDRWEAEALEQRRLWHKYKDYSYDI